MNIVTFYNIKPSCENYDKIENFLDIDCVFDDRQSVYARGVVSSYSLILITVLNYFLVMYQNQTNTILINVFIISGSVILQILNVFEKCIYCD